MTDHANLVLDIRGLHHVYPPDVRVLHDLNIQIARGQIVGLVGPSGCGKSTLLRSILGTHTPTKGEVVMMRPGPDGGAVSSVVRAPGRDRGIVYQRYALFPHLTAVDNVAIGLMFDETNVLDRTLGFMGWRKLKAQHRARAAAMLERVGLGDALDKYPQELSGGMRQRVAIAQALVMEPEVLLLDEPFGALDEATREELQEMLLGFYHENQDAARRGDPPPYTILIVTHELNEAIYVGDRVLGLSQYWDWKGAGFDASPGATIVYDKPAPIYALDQAKDYNMFRAQREDVRRVVFENDGSLDPAEHVVFWRDASDHGVAGQR